MPAAPKPVARKQKKRFHARRDPAYMAYIARLPCLLKDGDPMWARGAALPSAKVQHKGQWFNETDVAHVRTRAAGGDDRGNLVPLCHWHHMEQHDIGIRSFECRYGVDLKAEAARLWTLYQDTGRQESE